MDCGNPQLLSFNYVGLDNFPADDPIAQKLGGKIHGSSVWLPVDRVSAAICRRR